MTPPPRWPWHPRPRPGESLTSWLARLAAGYHLTSAELLAEPGQPALSPAEDRSLDLQAPGWVINLLATGTGMPPDEVRSLTINGYLPWLVDSLTPDDSGETFQTYVDQFSVLLPPGRKARRMVNCWRPWLPDPLLSRACPVCAQQPDAGRTLVSTIPITLTCPTHRCWLEDIFTAGTPPPFWLAAHKPRPASDEVCALDARTGQALSTGAVELPGRTVHAGVWFRLLRRMLDEVNTPVSHARTRHAAGLRLAWEHAGYPYRAGQSFWWPYEAMDWLTQQRMLEAVASAVHLAEAGAIAAPGVQGHLLRPPPPTPVDDGTRPRPSFQEVYAAARAAIRADRARSSDCTGRRYRVR